MAPLQYVSSRKVLMFYFVLLLFTSVHLCANSERQGLQRKQLFGRRRMLEIDDEEEEQLPPIKKKTSTSSSILNGKLSKPSLSIENQTKATKSNSLSGKSQTKLGKSSDLEKEKSSIVMKSQLKKLNSTSKASKSSGFTASTSKKSSDLLKVGSAKNKTTKTVSTFEKETKPQLKKKLNELEDSEKPKKKQSFSDEEGPQKPTKKQSFADEEESAKAKKKKSLSNEEEPKKPKKKQNFTDEEEQEAEKPKKKQKKIEEQEESEKPKKKKTTSSTTEKEESKQTQNTENKTKPQTSKEAKIQKKPQPIWIDQDDDDDIVSEFRDLHIKFQETLIPDLERISTTSRAYLFKANKEITRGVKPYVGNKYAATIASFVSFAFIIIPLILVSLVFNRIKAYFSIQKIVIFIQIYLAIYFSILCLTSVVTALEPLRFFYATSRSTYICLQVLQIFGYVLYLLMLLMYLILVFSTECGLGAKFLGLAQTFVGFAVGLHYYVAVFHRMVLHQPPKTNWKIHGIYATCFFAICLFSGAERRKKAYLEEGGEEGKKN